MYANILKMTMDKKDHRKRTFELNQKLAKLKTQALFFFAALHFHGTGNGTGRRMEGKGQKAA